MKKTIYWLTIIAIMSKFLGFIREIVMSYFYGAGVYTDIYQMASSAANIFGGWILTFAVIHTPLYQKIKISKSEYQARQFTNQILIIEIVLIILLMIFVIGGNKKIISCIANGFDRNQISITSKFFVWSVLAISFSAISQLFISELNCNGKMVIANGSNLLLSFSQIVIIFWGSLENNFELLKFAMPVSCGIQLIVLSSIEKIKIKETQIFPISDEVKNFFVLIIPVFVGSMMDEINSFVDKSFGSRLEEGSISALNYAHLLKQLCFYVFTTAIITVLYPKISEQIAKRNYNKTAQNINIAIDFMIFIFSYLMTYVCFFSFTIVRLIYKRGVFDEGDVVITAQSLIMYALALLPLAIREVLIRAFQAYQDTKTNMLIAVVSTVLNIILNFLLVDRFYHMGLALSTSIVAYMTIPILLYIFKKRNKYFDVKHTYISVGRSIVASIISCFISLFIVEKIGIKDNTVLECIGLLFVAFGVSILIYSIIMKFLKINLKIESI
ncbi:MAG: murein biosynthesis integral membrane protein MurJ [Dorea sp.]|nr:murein biosynthesis integral membrane protein MurJ [Dorea sp.]